MYCAVCNCGGEIALIVVFFSTKKMHRKITIYSFFHFFGYIILGGEKFARHVSIFSTIVRDLTVISIYYSLLRVTSCRLFQFMLMAHCRIFIFRRYVVLSPTCVILSISIFIKLRSVFFFSNEKRKFLLRKKWNRGGEGRERGKKYNYQMRFVVYGISKNCRNLVFRNPNSLRFY